MSVEEIIGRVGFSSRFTGGGLKGKNGAARATEPKMTVNSEEGFMSSIPIW